MTGRHLRRSVELEVAFLAHPLDEIVQQLRQLVLGILVAFSAKRLEQLGRELPAFDQRLEDSLFQRLERSVRLFAVIAPGVELRAARESRLEQKIGELLQQRLKIDRISHLGAEL